MNVLRSDYEPQPAHYFAPREAQPERRLHSGARRLWNGPKMTHNQNGGNYGSANLLTGAEGTAPRHDA